MGKVSKLGIPLDLKQFMLRTEVLKLYRDILRMVKLVPDEKDRKYLRDWAQQDFRTYKNVTDQWHIKFLITQGQNQLRELQKNLGRTH